MNQFTTRFASGIAGILSGFDRLLFRGSLRGICHPEGMGKFLGTHKVLYKDFGDFAEATTKQVKEASTALIRSLGRPEVFLASSRASKEAQARLLAQEHGITEGPICVLSCIEPCWTLKVRPNPQTKQKEIGLHEGKCLHLYHYGFHPVFGFMHARLQTWFPFSLQVCLNGREWLARQMDAEGLGYQRHENCFVSVADFERAQALLASQLQVNWPALLHAIAHATNPLQETLFAAFRTDYYWSLCESEWATDLVFRNPDTLHRLYPRLLQYGMSALSSPDVLRFLGHRVRLDGQIPASFAGEVSSDLKTRPEGARVKHWVNGNSVKVYDKAYTNQGAVLRVETTINNETDFKVFRPKEGQPDGDKQWRPLRRGVADLYRRAEVSQQCNERYLNALAGVEDGATLGELTQTITLPTSWNGKRVRALRPLDPDDLALFAAVSRGEFALNGLRNRDLQRLLYAPGAVPVAEARRRAGCVTRKLRLLRAHGILVKVAHTHRYQVTAKGRTILTAVLMAQQVPVVELLKRAA